VPIDDAPDDGRGRGHRDEVDADRASGEREAAERLAQEHEHREAHHADGHAREQGDEKEAGDVGLADELDVALEEAFHRKGFGLTPPGE
jgi:hypothetical protein